jgi:DNA-directed RNA polymerase subunit RPC12/RpoP
METKKVIINSDSSGDYTSLAAWEATLPKDLTNSDFEVRCGCCKKKIAEIDSADSLEIQCPRCKTKTAFVVKNFRRR